MKPLITCEHVDFGYENHDAVIDLNLEIYPGDYLCVVGENGSCKRSAGAFKAYIRYDQDGRGTEKQRNRLSSPADSGAAGFPCNRLGGSAVRNSGKKRKSPILWGWREKNGRFCHEAAGN